MVIYKRGVSELCLQLNGWQYLIKELIANMLLTHPGGHVGTIIMRKSSEESVKRGAKGKRGEMTLPNKITKIQVYTHICAYTYCTSIQSICREALNWSYSQRFNFSTFCFYSRIPNCITLIFFSEFHLKYPIMAMWKNSFWDIYKFIILVFAAFAIKHVIELIPLTILEKFLHLKWSLAVLRSAVWIDVESHTPVSAV